MIVQGKNVIRELLNSGKTINKLYVQNNLNDRVSNDLISLAKQKGVKIDFVPKVVLDRKANHHQGFVCETTDFEYSTVEEILDSEQVGKRFLVILDGIEDPHNLGAIIRTCECAGVTGVIIPDRRACQVNDTVIKTSAGATTNIKIARVNNLNNLVLDLKKQDIWVYALELGGKNIYNTNLRGDIAIVVGSEGYGVSRLLKQNCDDVMSLMQKGKVNSLNASVAAGIAIYEALRQRC